MGCGRQVGAVGFEYDPIERHRADDLGHAALFECHRTADAETEIAAAAQPFEGGGTLREGVEDAPQPTAVGAGALRLGFDDPAHVVPRRAGVDRYGQVESCGQPQLGDEGLGLLGDEGVAPIVVQPDFADRAEADACGRVEQVTIHAGQLFAPGGVVVDRRGVQPDHREAVFGVAAAEVEEPAVARGVDGGQQQRRDAGLAGPCDSRFAVVVKLRFVEVRVGIDQFHRARFIGFVEFPSSFSRLGKARTSSALLSAYRKRS